MNQSAAELLKERMKRLNGQYSEHLEQQKVTFETFLKLCNSNHLTTEARTELQFQAQQLSSTGAPYGFPAISAAGKILEETLIFHPNEAASFFVPYIQQLLDACATALEGKQRTKPLFGQGSASATKPAPVKQPLLLVVDDDRIVRTLLCELFSDDARIITGVNTNEALELMRTHQPDLVLLDDIMPGGVSGLRMLEDRNAMPDIKDIPVIMITASDKPEEMMRGLTAGAVDYITKPFDPEIVAAKVRERLERLR